MGILATHKIAKQLALKVTARRAERGGLFGYGSSNSARTEPRTVQMEPTYRTEPKEVFNSDKVSRFMKDIVDRRMRTFSYDATNGILMSKIMTDEIKNKVKSLQFFRYKIVCLVTLGESRDQSMMSSSLCCWDPTVDRHVTYKWTSPELYCTATVYAIYYEWHYYYKIWRTLKYWLIGSSPRLTIYISCLKKYINTEKYIIE